MGQPEKENRGQPDRDPAERDTPEADAASENEESGSSEQLKMPPHEKRRGTGLEDF
jgi:hypothetical protein